MAIPAAILSRLGAIAAANGGAASDYESIETYDVASAQAYVEFTNIPQTFKHLQLIAMIKRTGGNAADNTNIQFNGDTAANYSWHQFFGDGGTAYAGAGASQTSIRAIHSDATANVFGIAVIDILDYASTSKTKTTRTLAGWDDNFATAGYSLERSGAWYSTSAISSIKLTPASGSLAQFSHFSLFGLKG